MQHFILVLGICALFEGACGHGMMLKPPGRSSRWRYDSSAVRNYDDNELFCGGFTVHHGINGGKCGICGDDYRDPTPRPNELGGIYGAEGVIVETYENTNTIEISFNLTKNHLGYCYIDLCNMDEARKESEDCFKHRLKFADGSDKFYVGDKSAKFDATVVLPTGLKCQHCVMRWTYRGGNNWDFCGDGSYGALGCGAQEHFKSCADISIV